jgi:hypothetical protein
MAKHYACGIIVISALFLGFRTYANQIEYLRFVVLFTIFNLQERLSEILGNILYRWHGLRLST